MKRREFIRVVGGVAAALPLVVRAGRMIQVQVDDLKYMTKRESLFAQSRQK